MNTSTLLRRATRPFRSQTRRKTRQHHVAALEHLESRQLLTASMMWDGDALRIEGSDSADFIAVQQDELGLKVFTADAVFTEYEGRSLDTATSVDVFGRGGNDVLFSYQTEVPVTLNGDQGHDVLYSNRITDVLSGGDGFDWIQQGDSHTADAGSAFGIPGLDLDVQSLDTLPQFAADGRLSLEVDLAGEAEVVGVTTDMSGSATISSAGVMVSATGSADHLEDAFGIEDLDLTQTSLTITADSDASSGEGYQVDLVSTLHVESTQIAVEGSVEVTDALTTVAFTGAVDEWHDAFGLDDVDLSDVTLQGLGTVDGDQQSLALELSGQMLLDETQVAVSGSVAITPDQIDAVMQGSIASWEDAFGLNGLDLVDSDLLVVASTDRQVRHDVQVGVIGKMNVEETRLEVTGQVDLTPERVDAVFSGAVDNWDDAFGIEGFDLDQGRVDVRATTDRAEQHELQIDLFGDLDLGGQAAEVTGSLELTEDGLHASLTGQIDDAWDDAFGIAGLDLEDTTLSVAAIRDSSQRSLTLGLDADLDVGGTDVAVTGDVHIDRDGLSGSLTGVVVGTWVGAFGLSPLHLEDTVLTVDATKTAAQSELSLGLTAGMDVLGTRLGVDGRVDVTAEGLATDLTASLSGEWVNAMRVPGLNLTNPSLSIATSAETNNGSALQASIDTGLQLFGSQINVNGRLTMSEDGVDFELTPPESLDFDNLLGIPGFSLNDADLTVALDRDGLNVAIDSTMDMGGTAVDYTGSFSLSSDEVTASLTGRVAEWDNAFGLPGLNLNDVVLTLGAEYGTGGASMMIGLGAGIEMGQSEVSIAGLVGFGTTGWEVAFRGETESLLGDDLIDFVNTMNRAADPQAGLIAAGTLGDLELRAAFINFAPRGGHAELGIEDGFGIGGAFYNDGQLLGSGMFVADLASGTFEAGLNVPQLDLGPVKISDVLVDIRVSPDSSFFRAEGRAQLMGAEVQLKGEIRDDAFSLEGHTSLALAGLDSSVTFYVDQTGVRFVATTGGQAINAVKEEATAGIRAAANVAQTAIDAGQDVVDAAKREVRKLESQLDDARAEAQKDVDRVKANIAKAKAVVDSAARSKAYWLKQKKARYKSWRSAVAATRRAKWWQKPAAKVKEAARFASYAYAAGRYGAQVAVHKAAAVAYKGVRDAAGWVLDTAGVEANPEVIRIRALLTVAHVGVGLADTALDGLEAANAGVLQTLKTIDSFKVQRITISGNLNNDTSAGVGISVDTEFQGRSSQLSLHASTDEIFQQISKQVLGAIL